MNFPLFVSVLIGVITVIFAASLVVVILLAFHYLENMPKNRRPIKFLVCLRSDPYPAKRKKTGHSLEKKYRISVQIIF